MNRLFIGPISALSLINCMTLLGGAAIAAHLRSPGAFERTGAVIVAITGFFVVGQVLHEIRMERLLAELVEDDTTGVAELPALSKLAARIQGNTDRRRASAIRRARLTLVVLIALWLSVGEIVHGFGDVIFEAAAAAAGGGALVSSIASRDPLLERSMSSKGAHGSK
jgi:hypothetical protein